MYRTTSDRPTGWTRSVRSPSGTALTPRDSTVDAAADLQRSYGNRAVQRLARGNQVPPAIAHDLRARSGNQALQRLDSARLRHQDNVPDPTRPIAIQRLIGFEFETGWQLNRPKGNLERDDTV